MVKLHLKGYGSLNRGGTMADCPGEAGKVGVHLSKYERAQA